MDGALVVNGDRVSAAGGSRLRKYAVYIEYKS
jgi:hypothetical protein